MMCRVQRKSDFRMRKAEHVEVRKQLDLSWCNVQKKFMVAMPVFSFPPGFDANTEISGMH